MARADEQQRWRERCREAGRCTRCGKARLATLLRCAWCLAYTLEYRLRDMRHDLDEHARMLMLSHSDHAACVASKLTAAELRAQPEPDWDVLASAGRQW